MSKARLILPASASREEWLAARVSGITASEIAAVLGISPFESPFSLYWRKKGELGEVPDNDSMSLGRHLEPWIADKFASAHPEYGVELAGLFASTVRPWQMATPDRLLFDPLDCGHETQCLSPCSAPAALWEGKTASSYDGWGDDGTDEIPPYYRAQVLWQADTMGVPYVWLSCLFMHSRQVRHYRIEYDADDIQYMRNAAERFLARLKQDVPPPLDGHDATTGALKTLHPKVEGGDVEVGLTLAAAYEAVCEMAREVDERKSELTNELRAALGDSKTAVHNGQKVASRSIYERRGVDTDQLRREFPDAYEACLKTSTVDKITPARRSK